MTVINPDVDFMKYNECYSAPDNLHLDIASVLYHFVAITNSGVIYDLKVKNKIVRF